MVVYNPYDILVVKTAIPEFDSSKIVYFDIKVPDSWIIGNYLTKIYDHEGKRITSYYFRFEPNTNTPYIQRTLAPKWQINYSLKIQNNSQKPIGNFVAYVALPLTIPPQQIVRNLKIFPENLKLSTDIEGNHWTRFEFSKIAPTEEKSFSYSALVESYLLLVSRELTSIEKRNPYDNQFLLPYLKSEPHIESDHQEIIKLALKINSDNPLVFARRAAQEVQKIIRYEIQDDEYGAAYAIEHKKGDCTEFAALFVALCRAARIPARTTSGFALTNAWERHATAEFLVGGRWIPIDLTIRRGAEIILGNLPTNIIISRGNWMGGTITKEVAYKYQVIEKAQKLDVKIHWQILPHEKNSSSNNRAMAKTVKILDFNEQITSNLTPIITDNKKILLLGEPNIIKRQKELIKLKEKKEQTITEKQKDLEMIIHLPDVISKERTIECKINIKNNGESQLKACFEIRLQKDDTTKILVIKGLILGAEKEVSFTSKIPIKASGKHELFFVITNRIGRVLRKETRIVSLY